MKYSELVINILDYLDSHIYEDISIDLLSQIFCYDKTYLMKKFKSELGISIINYVNRMKIYNSLELLYSDELLLKIALNTGFNSLEYYSESFRKVMGVNPSSLRRYFKGTITKEELLKVKEALEEMMNFKNFILQYRLHLMEGNLLTLKNKRYAA